MPNLLLQISEEESGLLDRCLKAALARGDTALPKPRVQDVYSDAEREARETGAQVRDVVNRRLDEARRDLARHARDMAPRSRTALARRLLVDGIRQMALAARAPATTPAGVPSVSARSPTAPPSRPALIKRSPQP